MSLTTLLLLNSLVVWRVTRFFLRDSILEGTRQRFHEWLISPLPPKLWRDKVYELSVCPYCFSIWVAAGAVIVAEQYTSVALPVYVWLASSAGAMVVWRIVEDPED